MNIQGKRFDTNEAVEVELADGFIVSVKPIDNDAGLPWISPRAVLIG
ncbi:hypothetical protein SAMN04487897_101177 [Paenibacillus sp. yr247]|nr:hypothetical protein [Paenibacillus sp. yr247]SDM82767.1 hypothetical protein SAMN04487897_101177 [Paenibacillus sp. yr247]